MERQPNAIYTLSLSYGKDSIASIEACRQLGYPIDRIVHAEIWATDDISADLPPMVDFKSKADAIIKERYGIEVEHVCATAKDGSKQTYEKLFYHVPKRRAERERAILGFPQIKGNWCTSNLKRTAVRRATNRIPISHKMVYKRTQEASLTDTNKDQSRVFREQHLRLGARNSKPKQCVFRKAHRNKLSRYRSGRANKN